MKKNKNSYIFKLSIKKTQNNKCKCRGSLVTPHYQLLTTLTNTVPRRKGQEDLRQTAQS